MSDDFDPIGLPLEEVIPHSLMRKVAATDPLDADLVRHAMPRRSSSRNKSSNTDLAGTLVDAEKQAIIAALAWAVRLACTPLVAP